ncbi:MAG: 3-keto-5-aminohexanoate cleavage protein, partial [Balneolales bacterium]
VPVSVNEIVEQTQEAFEIGITIVHLHARDENGVPDYKTSIYRDIFEGIRNYCPGLIICGSTSGRLFPEFEKRSEVIELEPDMCSLTLSSLNFAHHASVNQPEIIQRLASKMSDFGVIPELECFDLGMINYGNYLIKKGHIKGPFYWNLLFGNIAGFQSEFIQLGASIAAIPSDHHIVLAGLGQYQLPVNATAIANGYGVRVGLEDNIWWDSDKSRKAKNLELVERIHRLIDIHGHSLFTTHELGSLGFYNKKMPLQEKVVI